MRKFHRVILMNDFMSDIAPVVWPEGNRTGKLLRPPRCAVLVTPVLFPGLFLHVGTSCPKPHKT